MDKIIEEEFGNFNMTSIIDTLDEYVEKQVDPRVVDGVAGVGLLFGFVFALFGSKKVRLGSFVVGATVGAGLGHALLDHIPSRPQDRRVEVGILICSAVVFGFLSVCMLRVAKVLIGLSYGVLLASLLNQSGILAGLDLFAWGILAVLIVACCIVSYLAFHYAVVAACAVVGAVAWSMSLNHFLNATNLRMFVVSPSLSHCEEPWRCWVVGVSGVILALIGTALGWRSLCSEPDYAMVKDQPAEEDKKRKKNNKQKVVHAEERPVSINSISLDNLTSSGNRAIIIVPVSHL